MTNPIERCKTELAILKTELNHAPMKDLGENVKIIDFFHTRLGALKNDISLLKQSAEEKDNITALNEGVTKCYKMLNDRCQQIFGRTVTEDREDEGFVLID